MSFHDDRASITIASELVKESKNRRINRLKKYQWGIGLEHEMQLFHKPVHTRGKIQSFTMFNPKPFIIQLLKKDGSISRRDREFLTALPFEPTGRICNGRVVLKKTPIPMPEFVTSEPFSSLEKGPRTIESYVKEMISKENTFMRLLHQNPSVVKAIEKYGHLSAYPFGMTSYFKYPQGENSSSPTYKFEKGRDGIDVLNTDYLGSYHITLTLPYTDKTSLRRFIRIHQNYANQIQWLEPLLLTAFFSCDQQAVGTTEKRIKGSYRVARIGWGNFAGSDIRKFAQGIGRYANIKSFWREGFEFHNVGKVRACEKLSPKLKKVEPGAESGYSSNFRTFGSTDPLRPWHRESGIGMTKPNGVELRIFDHFDSAYMFSLVRLVIYVAENSRIHQSTQYVYRNRDWTETLRTIMLRGWSARIPATKHSLDYPCSISLSECWG